MTKENINLAICGHDLKFIRPFIERCKKSSLYNIRIMEYSGHDIQDTITACNVLNWAQVIFCEWALGNAAWFSQNKKPGQILIVRLHLQEVQSRNDTNYIWEIDWTNVNRLILISQHIYDWIISNIPQITSRSSLIYNPIPAMGRFNKPKNPDKRYNLGMVGIVPARKRLDIAVYILRELLKYHKKYILRIKGAMPTDYKWMINRTNENKWYENLFCGIDDLMKSGHLIFDPHTSDIENWYRDIGQLLSVSDFEGSHQAIAESMASGCVPVIRNWRGANRIYPYKYVRNSIESLIELVRHNSELATFIDESEFSRNYSQQKFDEGDVCEQLEAIIHREVYMSNRSIVCNSISFEKMRRLPTITFLAYIPTGSRNGYRIRVEEEIKIFKRHGCKIQLICLVPENKSNNKSDENEHLEELKVLGCDVYLLSVNDLFSIEESPNSFNVLIDQIANLVNILKTDVIHAEALYCARIAYGVKKKIQNIIISVDWHGLVPEESRMSGASETRIQALEKYENLLLRKCDINIYVSKKMEEYYKNKYNLHDVKNIVIPCCINDKYYDQTEDFNPPIFSEKHIIYGYVGSMADWQCCSEMIQLFTQLHSISPESRFIFLVPKSDHKKLIENIEKYHLNEECFYLKEVSHNDIPAYIKDFHIGVLLRRNHPVNNVSSPTKYAEYLAAGIPVLMTDNIGDYSEHAQKYDVGMILPDSILGQNNVPSEQLKEIIKYAEQTNTNRKIIAQKCCNAVQELNWENAIVKLIAAYQKIMLGNN